jgi:pyridoxal biosynthesis lyase PdxS
MGTHLRSPHCVDILNNMPADLIIDERHVFPDGASFAHIRIWKVPKPVKGSRHDYKYSLAFVVDGRCVLRYDNERGKGDHRHWQDDESSYAFISIEKLLADFRDDVMRWRDENGAT